MLYSEISEWTNTTNTTYVFLQNILDMLQRHFDSSGFLWLTQQGESISNKILAIPRFGHRSHRSIIKIWKMCQILETKLAKFFKKADFF